ncbi:hypothetical protein CA600_10420 [Paenibacillus sp. VTT E-133280]|uniref:hypothetical protein n=1 Tax=Paenibacillus sp. VTT E-133280 TaxID=1986222 RepID=UPI000BA077A5|nr:hypothetical protein [Paenibacillus sp. VTT E-133280]OZQ66765.1 hypothetical protein CA600_10420 [Paenibacillus sp. VTT E-133280]
MNFQTNIKEWSNHHQISEKTIESWWKYIESMEMEQSENLIKYFESNFDKKSMVVECFKIGAYLSQWLIEDNVYLISYATIMYKGKEHGVYKLVFDIQGNIIDDSWDVE